MGGWGTRRVRIAVLGLTIALGVVAVVGGATVLEIQAYKGWLGNDFRLYQTLGAQWLATGRPYTPDPSASELSGQFRYPPPALYLFVAFRFIPWPLWWIVPLSITAWVIWSWKPGPWFWLIALVAVCLSDIFVTIGTGNTDMWVVAVIALTTRWPAASWLLVAKPCALPFTLPAIRRRGWWVGLALAAAISLPLLPLWFDWLRVLPLYHGAQGPVWLYGIVNWPVFAVPWLARLMSARHRAITWAWKGTEERGAAAHKLAARQSEGNFGEHSLARDAE